MIVRNAAIEYQVGASEEVTADGALRGPQYETVGRHLSDVPLHGDLGPDNPQHMSYPSYNGDRILVSKFAYELSDPKRWDVIVFKFPGDATTDARTNFIKRLVGLPGETVRIQHGDVWIRQRRGAVPDRAEAAGKTAGHAATGVRQRLHAANCRIRLAGAVAAGAAGRRQHGRGVEFRRLCDVSHRRHGRRRALASLPSSDAVLSAVAGRRGAAASRRRRTLAPELITDFTAYNTGRSSRAPTIRRRIADSLGLYWVGDLALRCTVDVEGDQGELLFELRKGGRRFQCRFDVATGQATLSISGRDMEQFQPTATTAVRGPGRHEIRFSNCDNELRLWVDGSVVPFDRADDLWRFGQHAARRERLRAGGRGHGRREGAAQPPCHLPRPLLHRRSVVRRARSDLAPAIRGSCRPPTARRRD